MSTLEDRIHDAYGAADTWGPEVLRPLPAPKRRLALRWVAPLTAATALLVMLTGTVYVFDQRRSAAPVGPPIATGPKPHFLVAGPERFGSEAYVADARTGKRIAKVPGPAGARGYVQVASTGDNRNFVLSAREGRCGTVFYRLRLRDNGTVARHAKIKNLRLAAHANDLAMAVTADGTRLAYVTQRCEQGDDSLAGSTLEVIDLSTGVRRSWSTDDHYVPSVSWTADGRLVFSYYTTGEPQPAEESGVRLLDTTRPGKSLQASSRELAPIPAHYSAISPDGQTIFAAVDGERTSRVTVSAYSAITGRKIGDLYVRTYVNPADPRPGFKLLKIDGTGQHLLVVVDWKLMRIAIGGGGGPGWLPARIRTGMEGNGDQNWDAAW